jgi:hypothetical protein
VNSGIEMPKASSGASGMTSLPANEAARIILHGMETNQYRILVGSDSKFLDFLCRLAPEYATNFIAKKMKALLG